MINLGIIGYGVRIDMLMDSLFSIPCDIRIKAVTDRDPERVRALMEKSAPQSTLHAMGLDKIDARLRTCRMDPAGISFYDDADKMLEREQLDGVLVGTRCDTHTFFAEKVLNRNLPLFLEKPVGVSLEELRRLKQCGDKTTAATVVSFPLRSSPIVREVKRIIDSGVIGKVEQIQAFNDVPYGFVYFHDWYREESISHGLFLQKATHDIDVLNFLVNEIPVEVCAMKSKQIYKGEMPAGLRCSDCPKWEICPDSSYNIEHVRNDTPRNDFCSFAVDTGNEDSGSMLLRYNSGMHAVYSQNFFARKGAARRGARLYGYKGTVEFNFATDEIKVYDHMSDQVSTTQMHTPAANHAGGDEVLMRNFIKLIENPAVDSVAPLQAGIESALACLKAKESAETKTFCAVSL